MATVHFFAQIASLIDRDIVKKAAKKYHTDKYSQNLDTWTHLIAMSFCHFAATVPSQPHPLQLAHVQLGDIYPHSFDEPYRLVDMVEPDGNERGGNRRKYSINGDIEGIENAHAHKTERFQAL